MRRFALDRTDEAQAKRAKLVSERSPWLSPIAINRLGNPHEVASFDCETHDWKDAPKRGRIGRFGWYTINPNSNFARLVKLSWAIGGREYRGTVRKKTRLIVPNGFEIAAKATDSHGITAEQARKDGVSLRDALIEFVTDMLTVAVGEGKICAHQFEFDANIIDEELLRCGLDELATSWRQAAATHGYCTMNPEIGLWILERGQYPTKKETSKHCLGLMHTVNLLQKYTELEFPDDCNSKSDPTDACRCVCLAMMRVADANRII